MGQQIINIPMVWDDNLFDQAIEKGVINEVRNNVTKQACKRLGIEDKWRYSPLFENIVKECMREILNENKEEIIAEVISRGHKSLINSKDFKEAKAQLVKGETNDSD